jgi:hypothetical protein
MENINIFEQAVRQKTRFSTHRGVISAEQLWDMPLTSKSGFDLDTVGQGVVAELESSTTRSLVNAKPHPRAAELELQLALIKHVIAFKQEENAANLAKAEKQAKRAKLIEQLGKKQDAAIEALSEDEIKKQLAALDD